MGVRRMPVAMLAVAAVAATLMVSSAPADEVDAQGLEEVASVALDRATHLEFMRRPVTVGGVTTDHVYALVGSRWDDNVAENGKWDAPGGGLNIIDITDPTAPAFIANIPCRTDNVDVAAVATNITMPRALSADGFVYDQTYDAVIAIASNTNGAGCGNTSAKTTDDRLPGNSVQFAGILKGEDLVPGTKAVHYFGGKVVEWVGNNNAWTDEIAHTVVAHPTRPIIYAGNQSVGDRSATVEIVDLSALSATKKMFVARSVGIPAALSGPHDITFNPEGDRAYFSSITASYVFDVSGDKVFAPALVSTLAAPGLKIHHEANLHPNLRHLLVVDEFVATSSDGDVTATNQCPGGGVHVFDVGNRTETAPRGELEVAPLQVGAFVADDTSLLAADYVNPDDPQATADEALSIGCTAHEFTMSPDGLWMPMAWMGAGIRLFDLSDLSAVGDGPPRPVVVTEFGHFKHHGINIWAAKVIPEHPGYVFASDESFGLRVFKVTAPLPTAA